MFEYIKKMSEIDSIVYYILHDWKVFAILEYIQK